MGIFATKRLQQGSAWRNRLVSLAPEANPHEFVQRYLQSKSLSASATRFLQRVADKPVHPLATR